MKGDTNYTISNFIYLVILQKNKDFPILYCKYLLGRGLHFGVY